MILRFFLSFTFYVSLFLNFISLNNQAAQASVIDIPPSGSTTPFIPSNQLDIEILSNPILPDIVELPQIGDKFLSKTGIAFVGSNPAFEVRLKNNDSIKRNGQSDMCYRLQQ